MGKVFIKMILIPGLNLLLKKFVGYKYGNLFQMHYNPDSMTSYKKLSIYIVAFPPK